MAVVVQVMVEAAASGEKHFPQLHKSHAEFRVQELSSRLPRMLGYAAHGLRAAEDMHPRLKMIYSAEQVRTLISLSRQLRPELRVVCVGCGLHALVFRT